MLGTTLGVEVRDSSTQLEVVTGLVAMTRRSDGQRVEVKAGHYATASESTKGPLQSQSFPDLPVEWFEDFQNGRPSGWRGGELVETEEGMAVLAVNTGQGEEKRFSVTTQNEWQEGGHGLCSLGENSVLHLRIRQSQYARITIMVATRTYPPAASKVGSNLFYTKKAWNEDLAANEWKTISVPLADVVWHLRKGIRSGEAPSLEGLAAYLVHVTTMNHDAGLIVDRIWIDSGREEQQP